MATRHPDFYFDEEGTVVFQVQDSLFRPHKFLLTRYCQYFRDSLDFAQLGRDGYGYSDESPIKLADVHLKNGTLVPEITSQQFAVGLNMLYPEKTLKFLTNIKNPSEDCRDILEVARRWGSDHITSILHDWVDTHNILSSKDKIILGLEYGIDPWLWEAFSDLALRVNSPEEEISLLPTPRQVECLRIRDSVRADVIRWVMVPSALIVHNARGCSGKTFTRANVEVLGGRASTPDMSLLDDGALVSAQDLCQTCGKLLPSWQDGIRKIAIFHTTRVCRPERMSQKTIKIRHPLSKSDLTFQ